MSRVIFVEKKHILTLVGYISSCAMITPIQAHFGSTQYHVRCEKQKFHRALKET